MTHAAPQIDAGYVKNSVLLKIFAKNEL